MSWPFSAGSGSKFPLRALSALTIALLISSCGGEPQDSAPTGVSDADSQSAGDSLPEDSAQSPDGDGHDSTAEPAPIRLVYSATRETQRVMLNDLPLSPNDLKDWSSGGGFIDYLTASKTEDYSVAVLQRLDGTRAIYVLPHAAQTEHPAPIPIALAEHTESLDGRLGLGPGRIAWPATTDDGLMLRTARFEIGPDGSSDAAVTVENLAPLDGLPLQIAFGDHWLFWREEVGLLTVLRAVNLDTGALQTFNNPPHAAVIVDTLPGDRVVVNSHGGLHISDGQDFEQLTPDLGIMTYYGAIAGQPGAGLPESLVVWSGAGGKEQVLLIDTAGALEPTPIHPSEAAVRGAVVLPDGHVIFSVRSTGADNLANTEVLDYADGAIQTVCTTSGTLRVTDADVDGVAVGVLNNKQVVRIERPGSAAAEPTVLAALPSNITQGPRIFASGAEVGLVTESMKQFWRLDLTDGAAISWEPPPTSRFPQLTEHGIVWLDNSVLSAPFVTTDGAIRQLAEWKTGPIEEPAVAGQYVVYRQGGWVAAPLDGDLPSTVLPDSRKVALGPDHLVLESETQTPGSPYVNIASYPLDGGEPIELGRIIGEARSVGSSLVAAVPLNEVGPALDAIPMDGSLPTRLIDAHAPLDAALWELVGEQLIWSDGRTLWRRPLTGAPATELATAQNDTFWLVPAPGHSRVLLVMRPLGESPGFSVSRSVDLDGSASLVTPVDLSGKTGWPLFDTTGNVVAIRSGLTTGLSSTTPAHFGVFLWTASTGSEFLGIGPDGRSVVTFGLGRCSLTDTTVAAPEEPLWTSSGDCTFTWSEGGERFAVSDLTGMWDIDTTTGAATEIPGPGRASSLIRLDDERLVANIVSAGESALWQVGADQLPKRLTPFDDATETLIEVLSP